MGRIRIIRQGKTQKKSFFFSTKKQKMTQQTIIYQMEPASQIVDFPINEDTFSVYSEGSNPRYSPYPENSPRSNGNRRRPGRNPEVPDEALDKVQLDRRNRNRLAAARCRDRRLRKVDDLESELEATKKEREALRKENEQLKEQLEKAHFNLAMKKDSSNNTFTQNNTESGYVTPDESVELEEVAVPTTESLERGAMLKPIKIVKQEAHYQPGPLSAFLMTPNGGLALTPLLHGSFAFPADSNSELFNAEFCQL